jgi:uncharacterized protein (TIGR00369 family)
MNELPDQKLERARKAFASVAYAKFLGLELCELKSGEVSVCLDVREDLKQNQGVVHGGAVASLIDTAAAFAILTELSLDERVTTTDLTIHYLRPITEGRLLAKAKIVRGGRRLFVVNVEVTNSDRLVATAITGYLKLQQNVQTLNKTPKNEP